MCNTGVGLTPIVDGTLHHFSAGGLYDGLVLLIDDETRTYWDHITGEARHGPLAGKRVETWGLEQTTVGAARRAHPELRVLLSKLPVKGRVMHWMLSKGPLKGRLPPGFRDTMTPIDDRLPEMEVGLGVIADRTQRFYPVSAIGDGLQDEIDGRGVRIWIGEDDAVPKAQWEDGVAPIQLFSRWYGFWSTYPGCEIYPADPLQSS